MQNMSGHSQQNRLPSIRDLQAPPGYTSQQQQHLSAVVLPPLTPPVIDSRSSSSPSLPLHHPPSQQPQTQAQPPPSSTAAAGVDLSEAIEMCYALCQQIERLSDEWANRDIQDQLDGLHTTSTALLQLIRQALPITDAGKPEYAMIRRARNLQEGMRMSYRRRTKKTTVGQRCHSCNTTETPEWRRGPDGARTLCNACGLHYSKLLRRGSMTVQRLQPSTPHRIIEFPGSSVQPVGMGIGYNPSAPSALPCPAMNDSEQLPLEYRAKSE